MKLKDKIEIYRKNQQPLTARQTCAILAVLFTLLYVVSSFNKPSQDEKLYASASTDSLFSATFVGDIMMDRGVAVVGERYGYDSLFSEVSHVWNESDIVMGNLESAVLSQDTSNFTKADKDIHFATTPLAVDALIDAGFNLVGVANNHVADYKEAGVLDTLKTLESKQLDYVGAGRNVDEAKEYHVIEHNDIKIAVVAISDAISKGASAQPEKAGIFSVNYSGYLDVINTASEEADLTIVVSHFGEEYTGVTNRQETLAHNFIDAGADIVVGAHPHVVQPVEHYKDGIIFYSLGNFVFDQGYTETRDSMIVNYNINTDGTTQFEVLPVRIVNATPRIATNKLAKNRIFHQLTKVLEQDTYQLLDDRMIIDGPSIDLEAINNRVLENQALELEQQLLEQQLLEEELLEQQVQQPSFY